MNGMLDFGYRGAGIFKEHGCRNSSELEDEMVTLTAHTSEKTQATSLEVRFHATIGKTDKSFSPLARPLVVGAIKASRAEPVPHGEVRRVADAHTTLLCRVDAKDTA